MHKRRPVLQGDEDEGISVKALSYRASHEALAQVVSLGGGKPFLQRLLKEYHRQFGHMRDDVMVMIGRLMVAYTKEKGRCPGASEFSPYAEFVRDELYNGANKFFQMGKRESELMFLGAMIFLLEENAPERGLFIRLWNERHQQRFWFGAPKTSKNRIAG